MTAWSGRSTRIRFVVCAPSSRPASSVTAAKTSDGEGWRATKTATRRSAACSRMICSDASAVEVPSTSKPYATRQNPSRLHARLRITHNAIVARSVRGVVALNSLNRDAESLLLRVIQQRRDRPQPRPPPGPALCRHVRLRSRVLTRRRPRCCGALKGWRQRRTSWSYRAVRPLAVNPRPGWIVSAGVSENDPCRSADRSGGVGSA
jgi:hypothetical protein